MYKQKRIGPKTDPCGRPVLMYRGDVFTFCKRTHCCRYSKYELSQLTARAEKLNWCLSLLTSISWLTVSKAFFKSKNTAPTTLPLSSEHFILSMKWHSAMMRGRRRRRRREKERDRGRQGWRVSPPHRPVPIHIKEEGAAGWSSCWRRRLSRRMSATGPPRSKRRGSWTSSRNSWKKINYRSLLFIPSFYFADIAWLPQFVLLFLYLLNKLMSQLN